MTTPMIPTTLSDHSSHGFLHLSIAPPRVLNRRAETPQDLEKQVESLGGDLLVESTSPNASSSRPAPLTLPGVASKWGTSDSGEDAGLLGRYWGWMVRRVEDSAGCSDWFGW